MSAGEAPVVRVLGGRWKGRKLEASSSTRPTSARARQALVNLLGSRVPGARVLDLFAGTGAVGIELVSRGAASAVLVERESAPLQRTLDRIGAADAVRVVAVPAQRAVADLVRAGERFDIVFADPPYGQSGAFDALHGISALLGEAGAMVLQVDAKTAAPALPGLALVQNRVYGRNVFFFFGML